MERRKCWRWCCYALYVWTDTHAFIHLSLSCCFCSLFISSKLMILCKSLTVHHVEHCLAALPRFSTMQHTHALLQHFHLLFNLYVSSWTSNIASPLCHTLPLCNAHTHHFYVTCTTWMSHRLAWRARQFLLFPHTSHQRFHFLFNLYVSHWTKACCALNIVSLLCHMHVHHFILYYIEHCAALHCHLINHHLTCIVFLSPVFLCSCFPSLLPLVSLGFAVVIFYLHLALQLLTLDLNCDWVPLVHFHFCHFFACLLLLSFIFGALLALAYIPCTLLLCRRYIRCSWR